MTRHWFYFYVVWFAPLAFIALFGEYVAGDGQQKRPVVTAEEQSGSPGRRADEPSPADAPTLV
jgi:hypothetical protein